METGCTDMETKIKCHMINFWAKLKSGNNNKLSSILCNLAVRLQEKEPDKYNFKWVCYVKYTLETAGFAYMWLDNNVEPASLKLVFQQRMTDMFKQNWHAEVHKNSQCDFYSKIKKNHGFEKYLSIQDCKARYSLTKFKTRSHHLPITRNRFDNEPSVSRQCTLCAAQSIGDETHYLLECSFFKNQRNKLLPKGFSVPKKDILNHIFSSDNENDSINLAKFTKAIMSHFKYLKTIQKVSPNKKKNKISRTGRHIKAPIKLDL